MTSGVISNEQKERAAGEGIDYANIPVEPPNKKPVTGMDVHNLSKVYKERLKKFSKESLLLHLSCHAAWRDLVGDFILTPGIEELEKQLKEWRGTARSNNRFKRVNAALDRIENGTWRPPKKRRRRKTPRRN